MMRFLQDETARKKGGNENEEWFWLNSIYMYEREHDDDIKRTTVTKNHKLLELLKIDSGQPSSKFTQTGAGLTAASATNPVSNGSREIWLYVVLGPRMLKFLISVRWRWSTVIRWYLILYRIIREFWILLCSKVCQLKTFNISVTL